MTNAKNRYDQEVRFMDLHAGDLIVRLQELYPTHLILFTADHGEEFLEHGVPGHGASLYESEIHVPLVAVSSATGRGARPRSTRLTSLVDVLPTVAEYAGVPVAGTDGESFLGELGRRGLLDRWFGASTARTILSESAYPSVAVHPDFLERPVAPTGPTHSPHDLVVRALLHAPSSRSTERGVFKLLESFGDSALLNSLRFHVHHRTELYRVDEDRGEDHNLFFDRSELVHLIRAASRVPLPDSIRGQALTPERRECLRSLGYIR